MTPGSRDIGVGLIGAGSFGRQLAGGVADVVGLRLVALHDSDEATAQRASLELGVPVAASLDELLAFPGLDAVIIATPHATHAPIAIRAAAMGRHLFVEKPLAVTAADASAIIAAAAQARVQLVVGHVTRLLPLVVAALERIDSGAIGTPLAAWMVRHQPLVRRGWMTRREEFGMLLHSPAIHNVDLLLRILGPATRVMAMAAPPVQVLDYPDIVSLLVEHTSGAVGSLGATVSDPLYTPFGTSSARIVGSEGGLAFDVARGTLDIQRTGGTGETIRVEDPAWGIDQAVRAELANFRDAMRGVAQPFVTPAEAFAAVAVCEAADRSVATRLPVDLDHL